MLAPAYQNVLLWRHADALALNERIHRDHDRPLSKKGLKQAKKVAHWLNEHLPNKTIILSSSAVRAKQTTQALTHDFITLDSLAPGVSYSSVIIAINDFSDQSQERLDLLVVGHQPWLGRLACYLLNEPTQPHDIEIKKGALWWVKRSATTDENTPFKLLTIQTPSLL